MTLLFYRPHQLSAQEYAMKPYRDPQISTEEMNTYDLMYRGIPALDHNVNKNQRQLNLQPQ